MGVRPSPDGWLPPGIGVPCTLLVPCSQSDCLSSSPVALLSAGFPATGVSSTSGHPWQRSSLAFRVIREFKENPHPSFLTWFLKSGHSPDAQIHMVLGSSHL